MTTQTQPDVRHTIAAYFAAVRAMDVEAWLRTFATDAVSHDPSAPPLRGHDALRQFFIGIAGAFQQLTLTEDDVFVTGQGAAVKWTGRGVGKNGRRVTFEGIDLFEFAADGTIQTLCAYWDPASMMTQLQR